MIDLIRIIKELPKSIVLVSKNSKFKLFLSLMKLSIVLHSIPIFLLVFLYMTSMVLGLEVKITFIEAVSKYYYSGTLMGIVSWRINLLYFIVTGIVASIIVLTDEL